MTSSSAFRFLALLLPLACSQQIGNVTEVHPQLTTQKCTTAGGCVTQNTSVVLDALSHRIEDIKTGASCVNSTGGFDTTICPSAEACATSCALEGINYAQHGVTSSGSTITLHQYLNVSGTEQEVSPRVYLLDTSGKNYDMLKLLNQEIAFTVDVSNLPCGMNGALYLSAMDASGGRSTKNPAGATYGTGYCDAQCGAPVCALAGGIRSFVLSDHLLTGLSGLDQWRGKCRQSWCML